MKQRLLTFSLCLSLVGISCDRDNDIIEDQLPATNYVVATEEVINEMKLIAQMSFSGNFGDYETCSQKTETQEEADLVTTLKFDGTKCVNGKTRAGAMVISLNPSNLNILIQLENFTVNGVKIQGIFSFAPVENGNFTQLIALNGQFTSGNERASFTANRKYTINDNVIEVVTGSSFVTEASKISRTKVLTPLTINTSCEARMFIPVEGKVEVETTADKTEIDFGNGDCKIWNKTQ